jgi:uncharacterized membrane protein
MTPSAIRIERLPARAGLTWLASGYKLFRGHALVWISLTSMLLFASTLLNLVPMIGPWLPELFSQLIAAAYMAGFAAIAQRGEMDINQVRDSLRPNAAALVTLGGIYMLALLLVVQLTLVLGGDALAQLTMLGARETPPEAEEAMQLMRAAMPALLTALILFTPIAMATWFSAPLAAFSGAAPVAALIASVKGSLVNWRPLLLFGVALIGALMLALLAAGLLFAPLGALGGVLAVLVVFVAMVVVVPVTLAATWLAYRDIYPRELVA